MKTFRIVFSALLLTAFVTASFASTPDSATAAKDLRREISKMIEAPNLEQLGMKETFVFINFKVNENNEIIVLNVLGVTDEICEQVKESINHRKVEGLGRDKAQEYNLRVNFVAEGALAKR